MIMMWIVVVCLQLELSKVSLYTCCLKVLLEGGLELQLLKLFHISACLAFQSNLTASSKLLVWG